MPSIVRRNVGRQAGEIIADRSRRTRSIDKRPRHARQVTEAADPLNRHPLSHAMIVIAANAVRHISPHPVDARPRLQAVIDQVAEKEAMIKLLANRLERVPVRVNIGNQEDVA